MAKISQEDLEKQQYEEDIARVKLPRGKQVIGIIDQRLGGSRMRARCLDGKTRICKIPGRLKRKLWVREEDTVLIEPWELDNDKGDVLFKYRKNQVSWLRQKGYIKEIAIEKEF